MPGLLWVTKSVKWVCFARSMVTHCWDMTLLTTIVYVSSHVLMSCVFVYMCVRVCDQRDGHACHVDNHEVHPCVTVCVCVFDSLYVSLVR